MEIAGRRLPEGNRWGREVLGRDAGRPWPAAGYDLAYDHGLEADFVAPRLGLLPARLPGSRLPRAHGEGGRLPGTDPR
ncbi:MULTISPECIES: hypothetical protein [Streptomyces]|uniref:hypothetical protein n=1 Tax=Streptomyces TaxID=1883 RepID=UPI000A691AF1|nr:hypothetical protein [Streptomyces durhamensis]